MNKLRNLLQHHWRPMLGGSALVTAVFAGGLVLAHEHQKGGHDDQEETEIVLRMTAIEGPAAAIATVEWSEDIDDGYTELEIEIEYVPVGEYTVTIGGDVKGVIQAREDGDEDGAEGELSFYSDGRPDALLLDFDPLGQLIEIRSNDAVLFEITMPEQPNIPPQASRGGRYKGHRDDGSHKHRSHRDRAGDDEDEYVVERWIMYLENTGAYPGAVATATLVIDEDGREFELEVENLPIGEYAVRVGGEARGTILVSATVRDDDGEVVSEETQGELVFSEDQDDPEDGELTFAVRGQPIAILKGDTILFQGEL